MCRSELHRDRYRRSKLSDMLSGQLHLLGFRL
nr:MAG TPA: hypothetical protein [Crassvirales sp.]